MSDCRHNAPDRGPDVGDVQNQRQQFDGQANEELIDKLVDCLYTLEGDSDISDIDQCLEELEQSDGLGEDFDVEQSLKEFHERYAPAFESSTQVNKVKRFCVRRPLARVAIIAAIIGTFVFTAQASGFDILGAIARWTSEQFSFVKVGEDNKDDLTSVGSYKTLQEVLDDSSVEERLSPTKFPEGAELSDILVRREKDDLLISAKYTLAGETFFVSIQGVANAPHSEVEIDDSNIDVYMSGEIDHYIMTDVRQIKATWYNGPWECYIAGYITKEDLLMMIDSIYE